MNIFQAIIFMTAVSGATLVSDRDVNVQFWGFAILLSGQPMWALESHRTKQWGIFALAIIYTFIYLHGMLVRLSGVLP